MIFNWSYENIVYTSVIIALTVVFVYGSRSTIGRLGILLGMAGIWLMIVRPVVTQKLDKETTEVTDIQEFLVSEQASITDTVILMGLNHHLGDLQMLDSFFVKLSSETRISPGFEFVQFPQRVKVGEEVIVYGKILREDSVNANVALRSPKDILLEPEYSRNDRFEFRFLAPAAGRFTYELMMISGQDTISELLPIQVEESEKLTMLVYASSPRFELNYLKNYWVGEGHGIVQKVKVSKDRFNTSSINADIKAVNRLNAEVLDQLNLLLFDSKMWNELSSGERSRTLRAVSDQGKGLIVIPKDDDQAAKGLPYYQLNAISATEWNGTKVLQADYTTGSAWIKQETGWLNRQGYGSIFLPRWDESYKLILNSKENEYRAYWSEVFSSLYRSYIEGFRVESPPITLAGERVEVSLLGVGQEDSLIYKKEVLPIMHTPYLESYGVASLVTDKGWNKVQRVQDQQESWFYAHNPNSWKTSRQLAVKENIARLANTERSIGTTYRKYIPLKWWIPLTIMLFGFGLTWLNEKLDFSFSE